MLTAAPLWVLWADPQMHGIRPLWGAVLATEALTMAAIAALPRRAIGGPLSSLYRVPLLNTTEAVASVALILTGWAAWHDRQAVALEHSPALLTATACIAASYLFLAWQRRLPGATWVGSLVVMVGLIHAAVWNYPGVVWQPWLTALLTHSTLAAAAAALLGQWSRRRASEGTAERVGRVLSTPLGDTAIVSSMLTLPVLPLVSWPSTASLAGCLYWLAAIWLVIGWRRRSALLFAAHQFMLALATGVATAAWLKHQSWVAELPGDLLHPYSLQAFGIALGVLSLGWIIARIALRGDATAEQLLNPAWPTVDWILRHALIVTQLVLVLIFLTPGIGEELQGGIGVSSAFRQTQQMICGGGAWLVLGTLAAMLIVALWQRWRNAELLGTLLLAATAPCLVAGRLAGDLAAASALRWGLACCFLVLSAALWGRKRLLTACRQARMNVDLDRNGSRIAHGVSLATTALPVIALTVVAAICQFGGVKPGGPLVDTFFHRLGPSISYLIPLAMVILGMAGHAVRESSAGYAFSAGLVAELAVALGYSLGVVLAPRPFGTVELVTLIQLATITAAAWALAWLVARRWINVWREGEKGDSPHLCEAPFGPFRQMGTVPFFRPQAVLMTVQLGMGVTGNAVLIGLALFALAFGTPAGQDWTVAAGMPLGWIALAGSVAAGVFRLAQQRRRLSANTLGLIGMTALGLLACTVCWILPALNVDAESAVWGYRTLMLGWAIYALFIASATWWVVGLRAAPNAQGPPQALVQAAAVWVRAAGILAVLLGLKAAIAGAAFGHNYEEHLWAAAAIAIASGAGATMAVWLRREGWAFSAGLGTNLAASLVVWYFHRSAGFADWWLRLAEANVIASSAVALAWLAARKRLYQLHALTLGESPLLATQIGLPVAGVIALLALPVAWLVRWPTHLPAWLARMADVPGWLALLLSAAAVAWYLGRVSCGKLTHVIGGLVAGIGVLAACHAGRDDSAVDRWLAYHTLTTAWAAGALAVLAIAWLGRRYAERGWRWPFIPLRSGEVPMELPAEAGAVNAMVQGWVTAVGGAAFALAVMHAADDRAGAWWSIWAVLSISFTAALLALWLRLPAYVFISGLLLNAAGVVGWLAWGPTTLSALLQVNVLCLAAGSVAWSLLAAAHRDGVPHWGVGDGKRGQSPFAGTARRVLRTNGDCPLFLAGRSVLPIGPSASPWGSWPCMRPPPSSPTSSACGICTSTSAGWIGSPWPRRPLRSSSACGTRGRDSCSRASTSSGCRRQEWPSVRQVWSRGCGAGGPRLHCRRL